MPVELTREATAAAASQHRLAAAVLAAPAVESEFDGLQFTLACLTIELALGHVHRAARAREAKGAR